MSRNLAKPGKSDGTWVTLNMLLSEEIKEGQTGGGWFVKPQKKLSEAFSLSPP